MRRNLQDMFISSLDKLGISWVRWNCARVLWPGGCHGRKVLYPNNSCYEGRRHGDHKTHCCCFFSVGWAVPKLRGLHLHDHSKEFKSEFDDYFSYSQNFQQTSSTLTWTWMNDGPSEIHPQTSRWILPGYISIQILGKPLRQRRTKNLRKYR